MEFERDRFNELCPRMPAYEHDPENCKKSKTTKAGKVTGGERTHSKSTEYYQTKKAEFEADNAGKDVIDDAEYGRIVAMDNAIWKHPDAAEILGNSDENEVIVRWEDRIPRRAKMDGPRPKLGIIADLKTIVGRPTPINFARNAAKFRWYIQQPFYLDAMTDFYGASDWRFLFILVGQDAPHEVAIHELPAGDAEWAEERTEKLVTELIDRRERDDWQAKYQRGVNVTPLPGYVKSDYWEAEDGSD
jgi:hypothetical protein